MGAIKDIYDIIGDLISKSDLHPLRVQLLQLKEELDNIMDQHSKLKNAYTELEQSHTALKSEKSKLITENKTLRAAAQERLNHMQDMGFDNIH